MWAMKTSKLKTKNKSAGFTLIELIALIALMGIILAIAIPSMVSYIDLVEERLCYINRKHVQRIYEAYLISNDYVHDDLKFQQYLDNSIGEVCRAKGLMTYLDGNVRCSIHEDHENEENKTDEVPWL